MTFNGQLFESGVALATTAPLPLILRYYNILALSPSFGPASGGTVISIEGTNLFPTGSCLFSSSDLPALSASLAGSLSYIQCSSPSFPLSHLSAVTGNGADVNFTISMYTGEFSNALGYQFTWPLSILTISPSIGPTNGNYPILIVGGGMLRTLSCRFGLGSAQLSRNATWLSSSSAKCVIPPFASGIASSSSDLVISFVNNRFQVEASAVFQYFQPVLIQPCGGPVSGGIFVSVALSRVLSDSLSLRNATCIFGSIGRSAASVLSNDRSRLACVSPAGLPQTLQLNVSLDGLHYSQQSLSFLMYLEPAIARIRPNSGPLQGETIVTLIGSNFLQSGLRNNGAAQQVVCRYGDLPQLGQNTQLFWAETVAAPLGSGVELRWICLSPKFTSIYGNFSRLGLSFSNFSVPISLSFDGQYYTAGNVLYNYFQVQSLEPSLGPVDGETVVTIVGPNMAQSLNEGRDMACLWNGELIVQAYLLSDLNYAYCTSPPKPTNLLSMSISLEIRLNNVQNSYSFDQKSFMYYRDPEIIRMSPTAAPRVGGFTLLVSGLYFFQHENLRCSFNTSGITKARYNYSLFSVECPIPSYLLGSPILFKVMVSLNAQQYADFGNKDATVFKYYGIDSVTPVATSLSAKNINVTLKGTNLKMFGTELLPVCITSVLDTTNLSDRTTGVYTEVQRSQAISFDQARQTIVCQAPSFALVPVSLFMDVDLGQTAILGGDSIRTADELMFTFYSDQSIASSADPDFALSRGGITLRVIGSGFMATGALLCKFQNYAGSSSTSGVYVSSSVARCPAPSFPIPAYPSPAHMFSRRLGEYTVANLFLSLNAGSTFLLRGPNCTVTFLPDAALSAIFPQEIPTSRADNIRIYAFGSSLSASPFLECRLQWSSQNLLLPLGTNCTFEDNCGNVSDSYIPNQLSASSGYNPNGLTVSQRNLCTDLVVVIPAVWSPSYLPLAESDFNLAFTVDGQIYTISSFQVSFYSIHSLSPSLGPSSRQVTVTVQGSNFATTSQQVLCKFSSSIVTGYRQSNSSVLCPVAYLAAGAYHVDIQVSQGATKLQAPWSNSGLMFLSYLEPVITRLEPSSGRNDLSHNITVFGANFAGNMLCRLIWNYSDYFVFEFIPNLPGVGVCLGIPAFEGYAGNAIIQLTRNGIQWSGGKYPNGSDSSIKFELFGLPSIFSLLPSYG